MAISLVPITIPSQTTSHPLQQASSLSPKREREDCQDNTGENPEAKRLRAINTVGQTIPVALNSYVELRTYPQPIPPAMPGLPQPWERFTEDKGSALGQSLQAVQHPGSQNTPSANLMAALDDSQPDYDTFLLGLSPSLVDDELSTLHATLPIPNVRQTSPLHCSRPSPSTSITTEQVAERRARSGFRKSLPSPKGSLRARACRFCQYIRGDSCSALRIRKPFFGYQRDFEEDLRGTPNVALRPLAAPLGAYVYEISQAAWPDLSIERTQQCTRQVFLGGARTRTGQLIRDDDEERSKRSLSDRLSSFSVIRHNLTSLKTNRVVSAYAHPASIRHWVAHAEMAQRLKGDLTTATMVPIDTPDGSAERPEALLDLPAWLLELDDEDEEEEDEEEEEEDKDEEEDDEEEEEDDEEDMEDVYVDVFELPSEADFDLDDTERETIAEYQRKRRLDLEDPPISPDEFLAGSSSSSSQVLSDDFADLDHMDYEEWEDLLAC